MKINSSASARTAHQFSPVLLLPAEVGEALLQEAVLQLLPEQQHIFLELLRALDAPRLQVRIDVLLVHLLHRQISQQGARLRQNLPRTMRVDLLQAEFPEVGLLKAVLVELVEDKVEDLLGGAAAGEENAPQLVRHSHRLRSASKGREDNQVLESLVEVFLVVVVGTGLALLASLRLGLGGKAVVGSAAVLGRAEQRAVLIHRIQARQLLFLLTSGCLEIGVIGKQIVGLQQKCLLIERVLLLAGHLVIEVFLPEEVVFRLQKPEVVTIVHVQKLMITIGPQLIIYQPIQLNLVKSSLQLALMPQMHPIGIASARDTWQSGRQAVC